MQTETRLAVTVLVFAVGSWVDSIGSTGYSTVSTVKSDEGFFSATCNRFDIRNDQNRVREEECGHAMLSLVQARDHQDGKIIDGHSSSGIVDSVRLFQVEYDCFVKDEAVVSTRDFHFD